MALFPRHRPFLALAKRASRAFALWLVVSVMVFQTLAPPSQAGIGGPRGDGLFAAVCASHADTDAATDDVLAAGGHCTLCRIPPGDALPPPERAALPAFDRVPVRVGPAPAIPSIPIAFASVPPLPSRGPPAVA